MAADDNRPKPQQGYSAGKLVELFGSGALVGEAKRAVKAWRDLGQPVEKLFSGDDSEEREAWYRAEGALRDLEEDLAAGLAAGGLEPWIFTVARQNVDTFVEGLKTQAEREAANLAREIADLGQGAPVGRNGAEDRASDLRGRLAKALAEATPSADRTLRQSKEAVRRVLQRGEYTAEAVDLKNQTLSFLLVRAFALGPQGVSIDRPRPGSVVAALQFFPPIELPDFTAKLIGLTLSEAFERFVLQDPLLRLAIKRADEASGACAFVLKGEHSFSSPLWPTQIDPAALGSLWLSRVSDDWDPATDCVEVQDAASFLAKRLAQFLAPFQAGTVTATGRLNRSAAEGVIPASVWKRPRTRIDFINSEICGVGLTGRHGDEQGTYDLEWTGVDIVATEQLNVSTKPNPTKSGRKRKFERDEILGKAFALIWEGDVDTPKQLGDLIKIILDIIAKDGSEEVLDESTVRKWLTSRHKPLLQALGLERNK